MRFLVILAVKRRPDCPIAWIAYCWLACRSGVLLQPHWSIDVLLTQIVLCPSTSKVPSFDTWQAANMFARLCDQSTIASCEQLRRGPIRAREQTSPCHLVSLPLRPRFNTSRNHSNRQDEGPADSCRGSFCEHL